MIDRNKAIETIEQALNAAVQKGVFADMQSAAFVFNCLQILKNDTGNNNNPSPQ